jgi:hypothetical protein
MLMGIGMLWVFRYTSNQYAIGKVKNEWHRRLYEMLLFTDEPLLIWKAQWGLLKANVRYLALMLIPAAVMALPMIVILAQLECFYGNAPLVPGRDAVVTVQLKENQPNVTPMLYVPDGIVLDSSPVRLEAEHQISWRLRALRPIVGELQFVFPALVVEKSVSAGTGLRYLSERRVSSALALIWHPGETRLPSGPVDWIELHYPKATVHALGLNLHWLVWCVLAFMATALIFKRPFRISF